VGHGKNPEKRTEIPHLGHFNAKNNGLLIFSLYCGFINSLTTKTDSYSVNTDLLRQILTVLFLPIAIFIFMIGWSLQWIGQNQNKSRVKTPQKGTVVEDDITDECVELKVIEDLMEQVLKGE